MGLAATLAKTVRATKKICPLASAIFMERVEFSDFLWISTFLYLYIVNTDVNYWPKLAWTNVTGLARTSLALTLCALSETWLAWPMLKYPKFVSSDYSVAISFVIRWTQSTLNWPIWSFLRLSLRPLAALTSIRSKRFFFKFHVRLHKEHCRRSNSTINTLQILVQN